MLTPRNTLHSPDPLLRATDDFYISVRPMTHHGKTRVWYDIACFFRYGYFLITPELNVEEMTAVSSAQSMFSLILIPSRLDATRRFVVSLCQT